MDDTAYQTEGNLLFLAVVLLAMLPAIAILRRSLVIVPSDQAFLVERLGRFHRVCTAGLYALIPGIDRVVREFSLLAEPVILPEQRCLSLEGSSLIVSGRMIMRIVEPQRAGYEVSDPAFAMLELFQRIAIDEAAQVPLSVSLDHPGSLSMKISERLGTVSQEWGVELVELELTLRPGSSAIA